MQNKKPNNEKKIESRKGLASLLSSVRIDEMWIALVVLVVVGAIAGWTFLSSLPGPVAEIVEEILVDEPIRHPLTGEVIQEAYESLPQVIGVMVENSADAWPLSGLDQAFMVIEAPVEAGIPRFLVLFSDEDEVDKIGPVRSARPYYVVWADSLQALYGHVGGSPDALEQILDGDTLDINQFWFGDYFWRENGTRFAPHNVFTTIELLIEASDRLDLQPLDYDQWIYGEVEPAEEPVLLVEIDFADGVVYDVDWEYDIDEESYLRYTYGSPTRMEDGANIWSDTVAVLAMDIRTIDNIGRKSIDTFSRGNALLFRMGNVDLVEWRMEDGGRITFYLNGGEVEMHPGVTWIEIVDDLSQVEYK